MATFEVIEKVGNDLRCKCTDPGLLLPRAKLSFWRDGKLLGRDYDLPTLSRKVSKFIDRAFTHLKEKDMLGFSLNKAVYLPHALAKCLK